MNSMLPIWLFLFLTIGAPLLWTLFDHLQMRSATGGGDDRSMHLRAGMPDLA